jgi:hypothetical protein
MDQTIRAILDTLPSTRRRSKLEPCEALIHELRRRGRSYREIVAILGERCGVHAGLHTVYHFVRVRAQKKRTAARERHAPARRVRPFLRSDRASQQPASNPSDDVWKRIAAVKDGRATNTSAAAPKEFAYDAEQPLHLIARTKPKPKQE